MAAVSKSKVAQSLRNRLNALGCPYTEGVDDSWIMELVFLRGEPRIRLLQWLLSKYDIRLGEMVENTQPGSVGVSRMDSRIQRLLFVVSSLGLCRYNDVDLIRGVETLTTSSLTKQVAFIDQLLDIVMIHDAAEDPLTKSMLTPGIVSDSTPLEEQLRADRRYMDNLASLQLPTTMLTPTVDLVPHDIRRLMMQQQSSKDSPKSPSLQKLTEMSHAVEKSLSRRMEVLQDLQETEGDLPETLAPGLVQRASQSLSLVLSELSQLVLNFTYCFENEMLPWCDKSPPSFSQLGPSFKRVHTLTLQFSQMLQGLHQIHQSYKQLSKGVSHKLKVTDDSHSALLAEVSQAAASSFQECVDILEQSLQHGHSTLTTSLCSTTLQL